MEEADGMREVIITGTALDKIFNVSGGKLKEWWSFKARNTRFL